MLDKFKYTECTPVINIIGGMEKGRGKFYAGIARAAFNTDAIIIDNGLASGLEKFTLRRGVKLVGIAPEGEIKFPKINPSQVDPMELANGHTHLFLVSKFMKYHRQPIERPSMGRRSSVQNRCLPENRRGSEAEKEIQMQDCQHNHGRCDFRHHLIDQTVCGK